MVHAVGAKVTENPEVFGNSSPFALLSVFLIALWVSSQIPKARVFKSIASLFKKANVVFSVTINPRPAGTWVKKEKKNFRNFDF